MGNNNLHTSLTELLSKDRVKSRLIDRIAYASDAGFYYLLPRAVVQPINEEEIAALFKFSREQSVPIVFRGGGTSLSGQSITDGILVDLSQYWTRHYVENEGHTIRVQPAITGAMANAYLKKFGRKIGPDPSSINAAMMGGIISNNASGMCCGVKHNSYHTTKHIRFILTSGKVFSTENPADYSRFELECSSLASELSQIKQQISFDRELYELIRNKYQTKNTVGYSLNAFIDYTHPLDIFAHLLVGGEGTLAFIAEAILETVPDRLYKSTALLYFRDIYAACQLIIPLTQAGAEMVELMDRASLRSIENMEGIDPFIRTLPESAAALLVEFQDDDLAHLNYLVSSFLTVAANQHFLKEPIFSTNFQQRDFLWKVRKGLFPAVGAIRAQGTTVILEDIVFPVAQLGDAILDLQKLFKKYNYENAIIFGHAKDGNIHFVVSQAFNNETEINRYDQFLREVVVLVIDKYNGSLKAEHGTGRNMAPFVQTEWGKDAYQIMKRIKAAADPLNLLNPGVIINADADVHIKDLKVLPVVEEEVDKCIECGFCEHKCPSRALTLTPRQRIVVRRAMVQLKNQGRQKEYKTLVKDYKYDGMETCAVDGLCAGACPVDINTGELVKRLRRESHSATGNFIANTVAKNFRLVEFGARLALKSGSFLNHLGGPKTMTKMTTGIRGILPDFPLWTEQILPPPDLSVLKKQKINHNSSFQTIVYFPSCISRVLGSSSVGGLNIMETFLNVSKKANIQVVISDQIAGSCCGQIFSSKGFKKAYQITANRIVDRLWNSSDNGKYMIVTDVSSCAHTLHQLRPALSPDNQQKFDLLKIVDSVDYLCDTVLPGLKLSALKKKEKVVLHSACTLQKLKTQDKFLKIAESFADQVIVPLHTGCCGMAGDRGFLFPELTASATFAEAAEVKRNEFDGYYSSAKTCEMAMSQAVNKNYESILYLVDECTG
ncbi:D-lactate dehydrogenase [Mucilaginibacter pineti]|uniref:D-lactate dehydrogenase (cytochrome) n=1 Tax=Mucilaginibacter pineti TaxID=1391627 RepID=A0A1G7M5N6_9SPHI|nr:FAD-binding and (Fe-S)-binding domain-containing protein [Mucilaginibacter pineti]SDF57078.1 D-lactate dehydrogenase [Mucilaginibacter pineti]